MIYAPPSIRYIFRFAEISLRILSKFLLEYIGGAYLLHREILWEFPIIFASEFPQIWRFGKFWVETGPNYTLQSNLQMIEHKLNKIRKIQTIKQTKIFFWK